MYVHAGVRHACRSERETYEKLPEDILNSNGMVSLLSKVEHSTNEQAIHSKANQPSQSYENVDVEHDLMGGTKRILELLEEANQSGEKVRMGVERI